MRRSALTYISLPLDSITLHAAIHIHIGNHDNWTPPHIIAVIFLSSYLQYLQCFSQKHKIRQWRLLLLQLSLCTGNLDRFILKALTTAMSRGRSTCLGETSGSTLKTGHSDGKRDPPPVPGSNELSNCTPKPTGFISILPASWIPYAELMRLDRRAGFYAFYLPYLIGLGYGSCLADSVPSPTHLLGLCGLFLIYCVMLRDAACS